MTRPSGSPPAGSAYVCSQSEVILEWLYCRTMEWLLPQTAAWPTSGGGEKAMTTAVMHSGADELEARRRDKCAQHASQAQ
jgi:hypothetical protein